VSAGSTAKIPPVSSTARRVLGVCAFALILFGGLRRDLFVVVFADRRALQRELSGAADLRAPGYPDFLQEVWRRTERGQAILVLFRPASGRSPESYAYYRARYFLPDRVVDAIDLSRTDSRVGLPGDSRYVAAWGIDLPQERYETIWRGSGGELARRPP
jgi:hypothetical protein